MSRFPWRPSPQPLPTPTDFTKCRPSTRGRITCGRLKRVSKHPSHNVPGWHTFLQNFQLKPMPLPSQTVQVLRSSDVNYTIDDLMGSQLRIFDGTAFVPITANNWPDPSLMTIVMMHGWMGPFALIDSHVNSSPFNLWPTDMALLMEEQGVSPSKANIVAWDWRYAATFPVDVGVPANRTSDQGVGLGRRSSITWEPVIHSHCIFLVTVWGLWQCCRHLIINTAQKSGNAIMHKFLGPQTWFMSPCLIRLLQQTQQKAK